MAEASRGVPLTQIGPGTWSNGHLRFDPVPRGWLIRLATASHAAQPVGKILWHGPWREWALFTAQGYVFAHDCLADITQFCRDRTRERKSAMTTDSEREAQIRALLEKRARKEWIVGLGREGNDIFALRGDALIQARAEIARLTEWEGDKPTPCRVDPNDGPPQEKG